ncbi:RNA polymerase sigma factor SigF, partial [[Kitasatospora] papulosa]
MSDGNGDGPVRDETIRSGAVRPAALPEQQARPHPEGGADGADEAQGRPAAPEQPQAERAGRMSEHGHHDPHDRSGARALFIELRA